MPLLGPDATLAVGLAPRRSATAARATASAARAATAGLRLAGDLPAHVVARVAAAAVRRVGALIVVGAREHGAAPRAVGQCLGGEGMVGRGHRAVAVGEDDRVELADQPGAGLVADHGADARA